MLSESDTAVPLDLHCWFFRGVVKEELKSHFRFFFFPWKLAVQNTEKRLLLPLFCISPSTIYSFVVARSLVQIIQILNNGGCLAKSLRFLRSVKKPLPSSFLREPIWQLAWDSLCLFPPGVA